MQKTFVKIQVAPPLPELVEGSLRLLGWLLLLLPTLALTELVEAAALPTVSRVKDSNTTTGYSFPGNFAEVDNYVFFTERTPTTGFELWKTDGTTAGTVMVKDINPGSVSALNNYSDLITIGNMLYFRANDGINGEELWKSDGTAAGTILVKDIMEGSSGSYPFDLTAVGNVLYFVAQKSDGYELWRSDGTASGTVMVKDIYQGYNSSFNYDSDPQFTAVGNTLYFMASDGVHGQELWRSDGTAAGTVLVKDIRSGGGSAWDNYNDPYFTAIGNVLYFRANNGVTGDELWKSDGSTAGTVLVKDINAGNGSSLGNYPDLTAIGNVLYFSAYDGVHGYELWRSDGTAAGTVMVKDINPGSGSALDSYYSDSDLTAVGNVLYFRANNGVNGSELWKSNGTAAGTVMVKHIYAHNFTTMGNVLYFDAAGELWKSDGTATGTVLVKDINPGSGSSLVWNSDITAIGNSLYFTANNGVNGYELWRSDGTAVGTVMVKDINPGSNDFYPDDLTAVGNILYFKAFDDIHGEELWRSDGTALGTVMVKDINSLGENSSLNEFSDLTAMGNVLYFSADNGVNGYELWRSNGTAAGTEMIIDIYHGATCTYPYNLTDVGNLLYFSAIDRINGGYKLWRSNGTAAGTTIVKDINLGDDDYYFILATIDNLLYFRASNGVNGYELWRSNGTAAGTIMVKDINPGSSNSLSTYSGLISVGKLLYFSANDGVHGEELWRSDGTAAGTVMLKDIRPGISSSYPDNLTAVGNLLYFSAKITELWRSDGTAAGTVMVKDTMAGNSGYAPKYLTVVGNTLYFSVNNGVNGYELWKSNGTTAGTVMVKDIWPGMGNSYPSSLTAVGNMLYFNANNGVHGDELWQTDGTAAGTQMVELVPGSGGSGPDSLTAIGTRLYFSAADDATGRELWRADIPNLLTVTPSANIGGVVTPNIPTAVAPNGSLKFTVTPLPTYNRNPTVGGTCPRGSWSAGAINAPSVWTTGAITANCTVVFGFISTLPDFVVTTITLNPVTPVRNGTFTATVTVKNQGAVSGDGKFLDVWSHQPLNQACGAAGTKRVTVGTLTPGQSKTFNITSLPSGIAGAKTLRAFVDSGCGTRESNEANNQMTKAYTVQ